VRGDCRSEQLLLCVHNITRCVHISPHPCGVYTYTRGFSVLSRLAKPTNSKNSIAISERSHNTRVSKYVRRAEFFAVALVNVCEDRRTVEVVWDQGSMKEFRYSSIVWSDQPDGVVQEKPAGKSSLAIVLLELT
jgi:hypothetical protein